MLSPAARAEGPQRQPEQEGADQRPGQGLAPAFLITGIAESGGPGQHDQRAIQEVNDPRRAAAQQQQDNADDQLHHRHAFADHHRPPEVAAERFLAEMLVQRQQRDQQGKNDEGPAYDGMERGQVHESSSAGDWMSRWWMSDHLPRKYTAGGRIFPEMLE